MQLLLPFAFAASAAEERRENMTETAGVSSKAGKARAPRKIQEDTVHEYPAIGKYRVRVLRKASGRSAGTSIDVREYVASEKFEGFTRRGIRLSAAAEVNRLRDALADAVARGWFDGEAVDGNGAA